MPGKGWSPILDLALSLAGLEASNEGIGNEVTEEKKAKTVSGEQE